MQFKRKYGLSAILILLLCASQISCKAFTSQNSAEDLKHRATEYWDLKLNQQFDKAFAYESPDTVNDVTLTQYLTSIGRGVEWLGAEPESVTIDGEKGTVTMKIRYRWTFTQNQPPEGLIGRYSEEWKLYDGKWYHVYTGRRGKKDEKAEPKADDTVEKQNQPLAPKPEPPAQKPPEQPETAAPKPGESAGKEGSAPATQSQEDAGGQGVTESPRPEQPHDKAGGQSKP